MNPVFPARRRAEQFSSMVEASSTGLSDTDSTGINADLLPLLAVVSSLRETPAPQARPGFVSDLRSQLMLAAETELVPETAEPVRETRTAPRRPARERRLAVAIGGFALVTASGSMSVAAQSALPGDTLYPLKRALENVQESVARDADDRGATMIGNAELRLDEVDRLSRSGEQDSEVIAETLQDFTDQAVEASDVLLGDYAETGRMSSIEELRAFTTQSLDALDQLEELVPPGARASLIEATRVLDTINQRVREACPSCDIASLLPGIATAAGVGPLLGEAVDAAPPPSAPTSRPPAPPATQKSRPPTAGSDPAPADLPSAEPPVAEPDQPEPPRDPRPPTTPPPAPKDPLGSVATDGLGDPLGDLLTGIGNTVDDLLPGVLPATPKN